MVFRSFSKLHPNRPVPHQISPPNSHFIKPGASFPGFYLSVQITRLARLPLLTPQTITSGQSLPAKKRTFSTLRPESLTHPDCELPSLVRWRRVPPGHPTLPFRLYLSDSESWSPIGRRREPPGQTTLPFPPHGWRDLSIQTASIFLLSDVGESLPATQLTFLSLPVQHSESWSPVGRRREPPGQTTLPFKPVARRGLPIRHGDSETTVGRRREPPGQTILPFKSHARWGLPVRHGNCWSHRRTSARASQPDKLILSVCSHHNIEPRRMLRARPFKQS